MSGKRRDPRFDAFPEDHQYTDTGCSHHSACLSCPLEECLLEDGRFLRDIQAERLAQGRRMQRLAASSRPTKDIAEQSGVSRRTVYRLLALARAAETSAGNGQPTLIPLPVT